MEPPPPKCYCLDYPRPVLQHVVCVNTPNSGFQDVTFRDTLHHASCLHVCVWGGGVVSYAKVQQGVVHTCVLVAH